MQACPYDRLGWFGQCRPSLKLTASEFRPSAMMDSPAEFWTAGVAEVLKPLEAMALCCVYGEF